MPDKPIVIGITGGSGSGKSKFLRDLTQGFDKSQVAVLPLDNYYKPIDEQPRDEQGVENFDLPESLDINQFLSDLNDLLSGKDIEVLEYTFNNTDKIPATIHISAAPVILVEGIYALYFEQLLAVTDLKIYIDAPEYIMVKRRIERDARERGYDLDDVLYRFEHHVTPTYTTYISPSRKQADLIVNNDHGFDRAVEVVRAYIRENAG